MPTALPAIPHVLAPQTFCSCPACLKARVARVDAFAQATVARNATRWALEEAEEWQTKLGAAKLSAARTEALGRSGTEDTVIAKMPSRDGSRSRVRPLGGEGSSVTRGQVA